MQATWITAAAAAALVLAAGPVRAQNVQGFYLGGGIGDFSTELDDISEVDDVDLDFDSDEDALKVFAGWRFNRFFAVQLDAIDFGSSTAATQSLDVSADTRGIAPSVIGTLPLGPVELFARAGIVWYDVDVDTSGNSIDIDESGNDPIYGAGVGFNVLGRLAFRAEYEVVDISELNDAHSVWLTASWRF